MKAIVLLKVSSGHMNEVHSRLRQLQTGMECCTSFGPYDEAAVVRVDSQEGLWQIPTCQIGPSCGVVEIFPCLIEDGMSLKSPPVQVWESVGISGQSMHAETMR
jgi:hypothetical protein